MLDFAWLGQINNFVQLWNFIIWNAWLFGIKVFESRYWSKKKDDRESLQIQMPNIVTLAPVSNSVVMTIKYCNLSPKSFLSEIKEFHAVSFFSPIKADFLSVFAETTRSELASTY